MSRLAREFRRLYQADPSAGAAQPPVRALLLEVARPALWQPLSAVWQGVQAELGLPAPAIAANGTDGLQLWFSLATPVDEPAGLAFLEQLRQRYMADVPLHRVTMAAAHTPTPTPRPVQAEGPWSAFVAADLAPVFEDSPWLDLPPNNEGQADLLQRLASIQPAEWAAAQQLLQPQAAERRAEPAPAAPAASPPAPASCQAHPQAAQFLLQVVNDSSAPLALRVEAAKALLPYAPPQR